jgi:hypothetical protein
MSDPTTLDNLHPLAVLGPAEDPEGGLVGYCTTTFSALRTLLGEAHIRNCDKVNSLWAFRCHDGTVFTVYDWKQSVTPTSEYRWHIGGHGRPLEAFTRHTGLPAVPYQRFL